MRTGPTRHHRAPTRQSRLASTTKIIVRALGARTACLEMDCPPRTDRSSSQSGSRPQTACDPQHPIGRIETATPPSCRAAPLSVRPRAIDACHSIGRLDSEIPCLAARMQPLRGRNPSRPDRQTACLLGRTGRTPAPIGGGAGAAAAAAAGGAAATLRGRVNLPFHPRAPRDPSIEMTGLTGSSRSRRCCRRAAS